MEPPSTVQKVYSGAYGGHFGYCRRFGVADREREPLAPLGCYIYSIALCGSFPCRTRFLVLPTVLQGSAKFLANPRILSLKFGHNRATYSWDITHFAFGVDGWVSLGCRCVWVLTINQLYPYLPFIFSSRARNGRFKKIFSCFVFNFFIEVLKTHVVFDYLNPACQAAVRPASFTRVFRAYYFGQSYLTVGFLFDCSAICF